jgi:hypothetical protein
VKGLKAALAACNLSRGGGKEKLTDRLAAFLQIEKPVKPVKVGTV